MEIHSNSEDAIHMVKGLKDLHVSDKCIVDAIKASIVPLMSVQFVHVFRDCIKVADHFAKYGLSLNHGLVSLVEVPLFVVSTIRAEFQSWV